MKNSPPPAVIRKYVVPGILGGGLLLIYLSSIAPGLTWANSGVDGGDLITAAATGGIAHPSGYPTYLLLARLFQELPVGSLAFRTNLLSLAAAVGTCLLVYALLIRIGPAIHPMAALAAGTAFGVSPLFWSQAVITEVYTLHVFFIVVILHLSLAPGQDEKFDALRGLVFGLALGNHLTTLLLLPLLLTPRAADGWQVDWKPLLRRLGWMGAGSLVYLILPLRASLMPPVNWGDPRTFENFVWLVTGQLYQDEFFVFGQVSFGSRIQSVSALLLDQFGILGLVVGLTGLVFSYRSSAFYRHLLWILFVFLTFSIVYVVRDAHIYLLPVFLVFSLLIGLGLDMLMGMVAGQYPFLRSAPALLLLIYLLGLGVVHWPQVDASGDARAEQFGEAVLTLAPKEALLFVQGDGAVFSLWYFHYALGQRPDVAVIASDLLGFDWYQGTLRKNYPFLSIPDPFPLPEEIIAANPHQAACRVAFDGQVQMSCDPPGVP